MTVRALAISVYQLYYHLLSVVFELVYYLLNECIVEGMFLYHLCKWKTGVTRHKSKVKYIVNKDSQF